MSNESEIFGEALKLSGAARDAYLAAACQGDEALRALVDGLLEAHVASQTFLADAGEGSSASQRELAEASRNLAADDHIGTVIAGKYKLLELIGEGGMGSVWLAEQREPVKRTVALKLIKAGMDSRAVLARFEAERTALALMDHPNIARILDAGIADDKGVRPLIKGVRPLLQKRPDPFVGGRPFFVMELVKGTPITEFCDARRLTPRERLELFIPVCQAIQHAHQKGIIHRDIKPSNVLVALYDDRPVPKVIDFGLAKATGQPLTEHTLNTGFSVVGTPQYMSPEQATFNQLDIDTRSDIYSLGVLLYELLAGSPPFKKQDLEKAGLIEILRVIREEDPPRPSTKASTAEASPSISAKRGTEPSKLAGLLRDELDWIVMKALEKERSRRYETANGFSADIQRYLAGEAVLAHPPSRVYRCKKFLRKHQGPVLGTVLVFSALIAGIVGTSLGLFQANAARQVADTEKQKAIDANLETEKRAKELEQVSNFQAGMLAQVNPTRAGELLAQNLQLKLTEGMARDQVPEVERATRIDALKASLPYINTTDVARELIDQTILQPAVAAIDRQFSDQPLVDAQLRQTLAKRYKDLGLYDASLPLQTRALDVRLRELGKDNPLTLESISYMGDLLYSLGRVDEAESYWREALEKRRIVLGETHKDTISSINSLGILLGAQGKPREAERYYREAVEKYRQLLGDDHEDTVVAIGNLGFVLSAQGKQAEAEPYFREALAISRRLQGESNRMTLHATVNLGALLRDLGKLDEAESYLREGLKRARAALGEEEPVTLRCLINLGMVLQAQGKNLDVVALLDPALPAARKAFTGSNAWRFARLLLMLGKAQTALHDFPAAAASLTEAETLFDPHRDPAPQDARECTQALFDLYTAWHIAEPDKGHDIQAAKWQTKLNELDVVLAAKSAEQQAPATEGKPAAPAKEP